MHVNARCKCSAHTEQWECDLSCQSQPGGNAIRTACWHLCENNSHGLKMSWFTLKFAIHSDTWKHSSKICSHWSLSLSCIHSEWITMVAFRASANSTVEKKLPVLIRKSHKKMSHLIWKVNTDCAVSCLMTLHPACLFLSTAPPPFLHTSCAQSKKWE